MTVQTAHPVKLSDDSLYQCMRCGFCLPVCPTYRVRQVEMASPRGRVGLMRAVLEGQLNILDIADRLDLCLGCRACEAACPAGVPYGQLLEESRALLTAVRPNPPLVRFAYNRVLGTPRGIRAAGRALWFYQVSGLQRFAHHHNLVERLTTPGLASMEQVVPPVPSPLQRSRRQRVYPARNGRKCRVAFFAGCVSDIVFPETNDNAMKVLAAAGCEVVVVPGQGCCGAVHSHAGEHEAALQQAKRNIAAFEKADYDYIVTATGGCGAALKEYGRLLADDPEWAERARRFSEACRDFSELLVALGGAESLPLRPLHGTVTYQDSCHLRNVQKVADQPRKLLRAIPGIRFVELPESDRCCGAAGTYAAFQTEMSDRILNEKIDKVKATGADTVVVANAPCQLEMAEGIQRAGLADRIRVRHIADLLAEALATESTPET